MARVWQLLVRADGDTKAAQKELRALQRSTRQFGQKVSGMGRTLTTAVTAPIVALGALGVSELRETMAVTQRTDAVFKSMGSTMKVTKGELSKLVGELESYSAIEGDIIQNAANVGLSFQALAGNPKLFEATTRAAVDMSAALGQDLQTTMVQLGKAMQNGAKGAAALGKNGTLAKADIEKLQKMAEDGAPMWKQQAFILAAVNKQYQGQGKNVDPIKQITIAVKNTAEALAVLLLPAIQKVAGWLQKLAAWVNGLSDTQRKWVGGLLLATAALGPVLMGVGSLIGLMAGLVTVTGVAIGPILLVVAAIAALAAIAVYAYTKSENFRKVVDTLGKVALVALKALLELVIRALDRLASDVITATRVSVAFAQALSGTVKSALGWIRDHAAAAWSTVNSAIDRARDFAIALGSALAGAVRTGIGWIRDNAAAAWSAVNSAIDRARDYANALASSLAGGVRDGIGWIRDKASAALSPFKTALEAIDGLLDRIKSAISAIKGGLDSIASKINSLPSLPSIKLPKFARGGITSGPSLAGEAGPEAVIPLGSSARETMDRNRVMRDAGLVGYGATASSGPTVVHVHPQSGDPEAIARRVAQIIGSRRVAMGGAL
jgi:phage-related protein